MNEVKDAQIFCTIESDGPRLNDVYGNDNFKSELSDIVTSMQNPMLFQMMGAKPPRSFLFYGPPGTGKTMVANAITNDLRDSLDDKLVAFMPYDIGKYGTPYINQGSKNIQAYFDAGEQLLTMDKSVYAVVRWFDEVDALLGKRGGSNSHKEDDKVAETIMKNLQEINNRGLNEYTFFATNFPDALDKASMRTGRVDKKIEFKLPDEQGRYNLFNGYINNINIFSHYKVIRNVNVDELVSLTDGFSCSDIEAVVERAINDKVMKELRTKVKGIIPAYWIGQRWLKDSVDIIKEENDIQYNQKKLIGFMRD